MPSTSEKEVTEQYQTEDKPQEVQELEQDHGVPQNDEQQNDQYEIYNDENPGPSFEDVFPEYAYANQCEADYGEEDFYQEDEDQLQYYFHKPSDGCSCCKGFIYNCDCDSAHFHDICECVEDKNFKPNFYFSTSNNVDHQQPEENTEAAA